MQVGFTHGLDEANMCIEDEVQQFTKALYMKKTFIEGSGPFRRTLAKVMLSERMEMLIAGVIFFNCVVICFETDKEAQCYPDFANDPDSCPTTASKYQWLSICNNAFLGIYTVEAVVMIFILRLDYFRHASYLFDFLICAGGWVALIMPSTVIKVSYWRILRCGRLFKAFHFVTNVPELYMLFKGFYGSMKAMFFGAMMLLALLIFSSILLVQLVHPVNSEITYESCPRCHRGFASIEHSVYTLFQNIVAGDSWGEISLPVLERDKIGLLLILVQMIIGIGAMNLILAVVVESAVEARQTKNEQGLRIKARQMKKRKKELLSAVQEMDTNRDGWIDRSEVMRAATKSAEFQERLKFMGITVEDLEQIIDAIEHSDTGGISYMEFCNALDAVEADDTRKSVVLLKMNLMCLRRDILSKFNQQELVLNEIKEGLCNRGRGVPSYPTFQQKSSFCFDDEDECCPECKSALKSFEPMIACETSLLQTEFAGIGFILDQCCGYGRKGVDTL